MGEPQVFEFDFFISRRGSVATVAQEVADVLEAAGYKVRVQDYDFAASGQFVRDIDDALKQARDLLILYSADYHGSFWTRQEFHNFLAAVAASDGARRICVLRCDAENPTGLLHSATFGDLHCVTDPAERRRIILAVARGEAPSARPTPRIFGGAMPPQNLLFTGREPELAALHAALCTTGRAALTQAPASPPGQAPPAGTSPAEASGQAALHGLGGVGKTTLARAYVARFAGEYSGVWWITATDRLAIQTGLLELARALDPSLPADATLEAASAQALATLAARRGEAPFLLVYDNVTSPELLDGLVPPRGAAVLVTSRASDWGGVAEEVPVDTLPEDAAAGFLQRRARRDDPAGATRLAQALGCLPLALDHAGAFVQRARITFDAYGERVAERIQAEPPRGVAYPRSVAATFGLAIEDAAREAPAAETLLRLFCWYAPDAIPLALADAEVMPEAEREAAVSALRGVSLLAPAPDGACGPAVSMHRLVQAVMRERLEARGNRGVMRDRAVARLAAGFPYGFRDAAAWPVCRQLLPHQQAMLVHFAPGDDAAELARLLDLAASFRQGSGDAAGALPLFRRALESFECVFGPEHPNTLGSVNNLAECMRALGDAAGALPLYCRSLESFERVLGPEHPHTLGSVNNLAVCMEALGDVAAALPLYRRALESCERVLGPEHPDTLSSVNNLAVCMEALGDVAGALPLYRRALEIRERVLGAEHPATLTSVNNLADTMRALGDAAGALPLFRRALESKERVLGPEHPATLTSVNNLAGCMEALGDVAGALPLYHRALESRERVLGPEHPDTLGSVNNLAGCLYALGDAAGALPLFRRAADGFERLFGPEHPSSRTVRANCTILEREIAAASRG